MAASKLKIVPLGGLGEVGKNMMTIEYGRNILVVDVGMMFPESDMLGIDYIIPDWDYLRDKGDRIRGVVITHGHRDHIGGLPHFLQEFNVPVYATRLARGLIEVDLRRKHMLDRVTLNTISDDDVLKIGPFKVEPYHVCHSLPDTVGLGISTPAGLLVHSGDFKLDHTPVDGKPTNYAKLAEFSARGVLALLSDSTNADQPGTTPSEAMLYDVFHRIMREVPGRLIIATFASLVSRIQQVIDVAQERGRKVAIAGRSMIESTQMAQELGYLHVPKGVLLSLDEIRKLPPQQVVILATGSQGEPMAVLSRLATGRHRSLKIEKDDTVVLSSHTIPGNEETTHGVINGLFQKGADVYYGPLADTHVSGHASQEEQKLLINLLRPTHFVPIHGELRHLKQHGKTARSLGIPAQNVGVVENGTVLDFTDGQLSVVERVPGGYVFVEGALVGETGPRVMAERDVLAQNGVVMAVVRYKRKSGEAVGKPRVMMHGFVFTPGADELVKGAEGVVRSAASVKAGTPSEEVERKIEQALSRYLYKETKLRPVVKAAAVSA
jgi:ribonuclease J